MRRVLLGAAAILAAAPAHAELLDARLESRAGEARLWLAFDAQPGEAALTLDPDGLTLRITGVSSAERRIEPARAAGVAALSLAPEAGGVRVRLTGAFDAASAEVRQGGVLIRLAGDGFRADPPLAAAPRAALRPDEVRPADAATTTPSEPGGPRDGTQPEGASPPPSTSPQAERADAAPADQATSRAPERLWAGVDGAAAPDPGAGEPSGPCAQSEAGLREDPWNIAAMTEHAACLAGIDETAGAAALYARVLAFEPENYDAAMGLGAIRAEAGDAESARALFEQAAGAARTDGQALQARSAARRAGEAG